MGFIADNTRTRWGRYRPYMRFMSVPVGIAVVLCFYAPDLSYTGKVVYAAITYVMMSMIFTSVDIPYWSLPAAMTQDLIGRTKILSCSRGVCTITWRSLGVILMPMIVFFGDGDMERGYFISAIVIAVICALCMNFGFYTVKENVEPPVKTKVSLKKTLSVIFGNKPLLLIISSNILTSLGSIAGTVQVYYAQYILGDIQIVALLSSIILPGFLLGIVLTPILTRKFGLKPTFIVCQLLAAVTFVGMYFATADSVMVLYVFYALNALPSGMLVILTGTMITNCVEYAEWKTGQRNEALICSTQTFVAKFTIAITTGLAGVVLSAVGYVPNAEQTPETIKAIHYSQQLQPYLQ